MSIYLGTIAHIFVVLIRHHNVLRNSKSFRLGGSPGTSPWCYSPDHVCSCDATGSSLVLSNIISIFFFRKVKHSVQLYLIYLFFFSKKIIFSLSGCFSVPILKIFGSPCFDPNKGGAACGRPAAPRPWPSPWTSEAHWIRVGICGVLVAMCHLEIAKSNLFHWHKQILLGYVRIFMFVSMLSVCAVVFFRVHWSPFFTVPFLIQ